MIYIEPTLYTLLSSFYSFYYKTIFSPFDNSGYMKVSQNFTHSFLKRGLKNRVVVKDYKVEYKTCGK